MSAKIINLQRDRKVPADEDVALRRLADERASVLAVEHARALLAESKDLRDVADMRDKAAAMAHYARARAAGSEAHADAWEIVQLATRRIGELTRELPKAPGKRSDREPRSGVIQGSTKAAAAAELGLSRLQVSRAEQLAALPEPEFKARVEAGRARITKQAEPDAVLATSAAAGYDGDEYGTPERYMLVVRRLLRGIDLDICSNAAANNIVRAKRFFTKQDSALGRPWKARTFFYQPPFSSELIAQLTQELGQHLARRHLRAGVGLTNCDPSAGWHKALQRCSSALCLVDHRIAFLLNGVPIKQNRYSQTFWYFGPDVKGFARLFRQFGTVCVRYEARS